MARYGSSGLSGMIHLNGDLLCVVDVETTGLDFTKHDIVQISIVPLDSDIRPIKIDPFVQNLIPTRPENIDPKAMTVTKLSLMDLQRTALESWDAIDIFDEWFKRLRLPVGKKIQPLAHNWPFDREFIKEWLGGPKNFEHYFSHLYRDSMAAAILYNDRAEQHLEPQPYPGDVRLNTVGNKLKIRNAKAHDALQDTLQTAEVYRALLRCYTPTTANADAISLRDFQQAMGADAYNAVVQKITAQREAARLLSEAGKPGTGPAPPSAV